jgi:hypothetical protein
MRALTSSAACSRNHSDRVRAAADAKPSLCQLNQAEASRVDRGPVVARAHLDRQRPRTDAWVEKTGGWPRCERNPAGRTMSSRLPLTEETMNSLEAHMLMRYPGLAYRDHATSNDWARVVATFPLFSGVGKRRMLSDQITFKPDRR